MNWILYIVGGYFWWAFWGVIFRGFLEGICNIRCSIPEGQTVIALHQFLIICSWVWICWRYIR